jgi:hypothetical protein
MPLATSCRLIKEPQVLSSPYRFSPLHHSPYKTVDSSESLREARNNVRGLRVACMWRATRSPPLRGIPHAACSEADPLLACSLARSLVYSHSLATLPPFLPHPPRRCMCATRSPPQHSRPFHTLPAAVSCHRRNSLAPSSFLARSLARSLVHPHSLATAESMQIQEVIL